MEREYVDIGNADNIVNESNLRYDIILADFGYKYPSINRRPVSQE